MRQRDVAILAQHFILNHTANKKHVSPVKAVDEMQMDPDYCLRRLTETVYAHVFTCCCISGHRRLTSRRAWLRICHYISVLCDMRVVALN